MAKNNSIGIMQGRLTNPKGRGIQFFPFENWQNEFKIARRLNIDEIEFIFDLPKYRQNPLWSNKGRKKIISLIKSTGVVVNSVCADYFMRRPFFRSEKSILNSNVYVLKKLIKYSSEVGAKLVEIPLVDNSSTRNLKDMTSFVNIIKGCTREIEKYNVRVGLETDLMPKKFILLIEKIGHHMVGANYDTGNSSSLGYNPEEEVETFGKYIFNIHIKDRIYKGVTVPLGTGDTQFEVFLRCLRKIGYNGSFILQAARGENGKEVENIRSQVKFLKSYGFKT